jgi:hypothetical protein
MNINYFVEYENYKSKGIKATAKEYMQKFIKSFKNDTEKELWTIKYLSKLEINQKEPIVNDLFEGIILPVLITGYKNNNVNLIIRLIKLAHNYHQNKNIHKRIMEELNYKPWLEIIKECYSMEPNNKYIQEIYSEKLIGELDYSVHEFPYILYGNKSATKENCKELLKEIKIIKELDKENKYEERIIEYENRIKEYMNKK